MPRPPLLDRPTRAAGKLAFVYVLVAGAWIVLSDAAVQGLIQDPSSVQLAQTFKGTLFVLVTGAVLFFLVRHQVRFAEDSSAHGRLLEAAVEATSEAVLITDAEGRIEYANPAFEATTGYTLDEVQGQNPRLLKSNRQPEGFYDRMWRTLRAGRIFEGEFVNQRKDGTLYWKEGTITPIPNDRGRSTHYIDVSRNVTEQRRLQRQLREAQKAELLGHISGGIVHDSRNVLAVIQAHADLALAACERGQVPVDEIAEIMQAVGHGSELLKAFLSLSRKEELEFQTVSLGKLLAEMQATLRAVFPASVEIEIETEAEKTTQVDPGSVHQMILNLATNARDAMVGGGRFTLRLSTAEGDVADPQRPDSGLTTPDSAAGARRWVVLEASDTGTGMDEETRSRVFEPLFTTKPADRGTGLGMSMVARLMEDHGGRATVESSPGVGTTVRLFFPMTTAGNSAGGRGAVPVEHPMDLPRGSETVLVVEDEKPLRDALSRSLERLGYRALVAENGVEALDRLNSERMDLVITDLVMPRMGGRELADEMRMLGWAKVPVIFVSGYHLQEMDAGPEADADQHFLEKPWTLSALARKVRHVLDTHTGLPV